VSHWRVYEGEQIEVWPIPTDNADTTSREGQLKIVGTRNLNPLVADGDVCDLDDRLVAMFAAVEFITDPGLAKYKNNLANTRLIKLRGNLVKETKFRMFGIGEPENVRQLRGPPTVYYRKDS